LLCFGWIDGIKRKIDNQKKSNAINFSLKIATLGANV
jgi:hypothetical protein